MAVRQRITKFKNLLVAVAELEQFVRDPRHLMVGKPIARFADARPRELLANWLICAAMNSVEGRERYTFTSDPTGGDGIILDTATQNTWPTEHVMVPPARKAGASLDDRLLAGIKAKVAKGGQAYAAGKTLVVFVEGGPENWYPNRVARALPDPLHFDTVWIVGLCEAGSGGYKYGVANLDLSAGNAPTFRVTVFLAFDGWNVGRIQ
jgi:hypothetical protein